MSSLVGDKTPPEETKEIIDAQKEYSGTYVDVDASWLPSYQC